MYTITEKFWNSQIIAEIVVDGKMSESAVCENAALYDKGFMIRGGLNENNEFEMPT